MGETHEVSISLVEGMHFEGWGYPPGEGSPIPMDSAAGFGGEGKGARSQSLLLVALAGCTGMDVISILRKKRETVTGLEIKVRAEKAEEHPKVYTHIWLTYVVTGQSVSREAVERAIELSMTRYCPVSGMLSQIIPIDTEIQIVEG